MPPTATARDGTQVDPTAAALTKAIRSAETGGDYNAKGASGEHGAYQWMPGNYEAMAKEAGLDSNDFSPVNQDKAAYHRVKSLLDQGYTQSQVASLWNSGSPDWQGKVGVNKHGVHYDVPAYVDKVKNAYLQESGNTSSYAPPQLGGVAHAAIQGDSPYAPPQAPQAPSYDASTGTPVENETLGGQISNRFSQAGAALDKAATGKINPLSGLLQTAGAAGGFVGDVTNDALKLIPGVKQGEELLGKGVGKLAQTAPGQAVASGVSDFSQAHPELAGDIGAVGNIVSAIPAFKGVGLLKDAAGSALTGTGKNALIEAISPEIKAGTKAGAKNVLKNGTEKQGLLGTITRVDDPQMVEAAPIIKEVVPNFMKLKTYSERIDAVKGGVGTLAEKLKTNIANPEIQPILTAEDMQVLQKEIETQVARNPLLTGDAGTQAHKIFDQFKRFLPTDREVTMSDVLEARKKLDNWISDIKGGTVFDPKTENALSVGLRAVRQGANNLLESKVPEGEVKDLLRKQSLLYRVMENMAPKASREVGTNGLMRAAARHPQITGAAKYLAGMTAAGLGLGGAEKLLNNHSAQ